MIINCPLTQTGSISINDTIYCFLGMDDTWKSVSSCHKLDGNTWTSQPKMKQERTSAAASSTAKGGMFVTGGLDLTLTPLLSTEVLNNGEWEEGPKMPVRLAQHCQVHSESGIIVAGELEIHLRCYIDNYMQERIGIIIRTLLCIDLKEEIGKKWPRKSGLIGAVTHVS